MDINKKFKTGVLWQDIQHQELFDLINKISSPEADKLETSMYTYTLGFLVMYTHHHFNLEEGYMKEYQYPDLEFHQKEHKRFIQQLKDIRSKYPVHTNEAVDILKNNVQDWILNHILANDLKLGEFIAKKEKERFSN